MVLERIEKLDRDFFPHFLSESASRFSELTAPMDDVPLIPRVLKPSLDLKMEDRDANICTVYVHHGQWHVFR